ncbi:hypothetical protein [Lysobacter sp. yr284]|uniref:hypothetical protein n=1 Tax=Lysobacter sp. yr284 TaxID=1761791 RepID=UPI001C31CEC1|nr:hypothetical protein [Lysobacter sp. yr284]
MPVIAALQTDDALRLDADTLASNRAADELIAQACSQPKRYGLHFSIKKIERLMYFW